MVIDFRAHVVALVAVFLALGIGILIGSGMGSQWIAHTQQAIVQRLESDFDSMHQANAKLQAQNGQLRGLLSSEDRFAQQVAPTLVARRLVGMRVAILTTRSDIRLGNLQDAVRMAGGSIGLVVQMHGPVSAAQQQAIAGMLPDKPQPSQVLPALATQTQQALESGTPEAMRFLQTIQAVGVWQVSGTLGGRIQGVVLVGGQPTGFDPLAAEFLSPLGRALRAAGTNVVGVDASSDVVQAVDTFSGAGMSTVDDIERPMGQIAAVLVLSGRQGRYGVLQGDQAVVPQLGP